MPGVTGAAPELSVSPNQRSAIWKESSTMGRVPGGIRVVSIYHWFHFSIKNYYMWPHDCFSGSCSPSCLNGGRCVNGDSCNCSLYQATGNRCQTVPNTGFEREMTCRTWGQYNYETFDGLYYYFPGVCSYTLVRDCEDPSQTGVVHNDPGCRSSPHSCARSVSLYLPWEGEIRLHKHNVTFKGQSVELPHSIHDVELERIAQYVVVTQPHGFTLAWEGSSSSVYIKMSPEHVGRTCGLCGNFNADIQDDLRTSYGGCTSKITMIHFACKTSYLVQKVKEVCALFLDEPFKPCHEFVSPYPYMASCSNDLCLLGPNDEAVCRALTEYARACGHAEHPLQGWREHIRRCVVSCPTDLLYRECISCCPVSCSMERMCIDSRLECLDGCYCPEGEASVGRCVEAADCPCEYHGTTYMSGQTVQEECNSCTCMGGLWNCTEYTCPGECSVTGDIYFETFDGRVYTFHATCQYVLAKSHSSGRFTVTIQNAPCGPNLDGACIQSVTLVIDEDPRMEVTLSRSGEVFVSGQCAAPRCKTNGFLCLFLEVFHIQELSSMFLQVRAAHGLRLLYNWREFRLYLQVDEFWKDDTVGLCGTFNGNSQDDFFSPSGMIESTPQLFGNSWKLSSACVQSPGLPQLDPCDTHQQAASYAAEMCGVLDGELFSPCHEHLSPLSFVQRCKADTCKCGKPCLCSALAHYARQCRKHGVNVDFRANVTQCAPECPGTTEYGTCVSSCQRRCPSDGVLQRCGEECEEGCICPHGTLYRSRTRTYKTCPLGQHYHECAPPGEEPSPGRGLECEHTCESYLLNLTCSAHEPCVSGCVCPPGLLRHGDECFEPETCPCVWKGKEYYPGDKVTSPCHHCVCQRGTFRCEFRPCPAMCSIYGDRHYRTFDGLQFDYVGACKVLIDGQQGVLLWQAGVFTVLHIPKEDLTVLWDRKTTIHIQAGPRWQGKLSGLCGNFDMKTMNEMRTPENIVSATPQEFGNSWTAAECVNSPDIRHPCSLSPLREPFAKRRCGILLSELFQACHPVVDVTWFYTNCLTDTCGCSRGGDCECFCTSVAAYAHRCCQLGITVDWRSPAVCRECTHRGGGFLGKGPLRLVTYRDRSTALAANVSGGLVFPLKGGLSASGVTTLFMMTPGLSRVRPHDTTLVSLEVAERPNYFLRADRSGRLRPVKWEESARFWDESTFVLHRDTWINGYDSLESFAWRGRFLHAVAFQARLMKYNHTDGFRKSTLFRLSESGIFMGPRCQWRYESCISPCFKTCSDPSGRACTGIPKVEGCIPQCPGHMVLDEVTQRCVHMEDCKLQRDFHVTSLTMEKNTFFTSRITTASSTTTPSTTVYSQMILFNKSQNCPYDATPPNCGLLGFAILVNGDKCCPLWDCPCRCSVFPDLNVITFDGNSVAIYKAASYIVSQLPNETVSIQAASKLLWNFTSLCLVALNITHNSHQVLINRVQRRVMQSVVLDTGNMYLIRTPEGMKMQWFHSTGMLVIEIESHKKLSTMGLCGCCDGNPANDLTMSNGTTVREGEDPAVFIDSWQVPNTTSYVSHSRRREVNCSTSDCSQCLDMLHNNSFSPCHAFVLPSVFCELWVRDEEYVKNPCVSLAAYVASCHKFNVCVEWRRPDYCPFMCPAGLRYQACLPACTAQACPNHEFDSEPPECSGLTEGCVCPEGTLLHRPYSPLCIPSEKCACTDSFGNPRAPGEVWTASKDGCCMYKCDNDSIVPVEYDCTDVPQPVCRKMGEVMVSLADDKSCCPWKVCECDPDRCESDIPTCREDQTLIATRADGSCCLAHICSESWGPTTPTYPCGEPSVNSAIIVCVYVQTTVCGPCADIIPKCQEGEVLTVDANSTDRCCPIYHCVCEPYRCPKFTCPLGMSVTTASLPEQCCPVHACGKPAGPPRTHFPGDSLHQPLLLLCLHQLLPHLICFPECAVCVDGERGVMRPGQTLVEHSAEGICYTTHCTRTLDPVTGFFRTRASSTNCSSQCQPNQVYIPPKGQTTCCGTCKNISCIYMNENGSVELYKPGRTWVSNCLKYNCADMLSGPTLVSYPFSCPPFNETECMKVSLGINSHFLKGTENKRSRFLERSINSCQKVTVRMTIRKNDCRSNRPVNIVSCDGKCPSASIYNYNINTYARFCKCCREMGLQRRSVQLFCSGNSTWVSYTIQEPTDCSCQWS
uniref:Otogelin n=1 Tax=Scleropages formosus TaxID=113540 RepID=A0A8C9VDF4_SCLFO